jgi:hypothetical protein
MNRKIAQPSIEAIAHHEAGHTVAAWRYHIPFKHVTILPEPGRAGQAGSLGHLLHGRAPKWFRPDIESSDRIVLHLERHIITAFAGQIAQAKFQHRRPHSGMDGDNHTAVDLAFHLGSSVETTEAYLRYCFLRAWDLVHSPPNWRAIKAVAATLLERQTLTSDEVLDVIMPGSTALRDKLRAAAGRLGRR